MNSTCDIYPFSNPSSHPHLFCAFPERADDFSTRFPMYWSPYKSPLEKLDYERRLPIEIQPFIRAYFERYKSQIVRLQESETTTDYLHHLQDAWNKHIAVNRAVDCFLSYETGNPFDDWSIEEWRIAKRLLFAAMDTDHKKTLYSAGVKGKLDRELGRLCARYGRCDPFFVTAILTPSFATFYESRELDRMKYQLSLLEGGPIEPLKTHIVDRYHAGDEGVFNLRSERRPADLDARRLRSEVLQLEAPIRARAIRKGYLLMERPDAKSFEALLKFDNVTEYEHTFSLKGLPDLFLREEVLRRAVMAGELAKGTSVFSLSFDDFAGIIDRLILAADESFKIQLRPYRQNFDTCGTACIMSILNRKGLRLNEENELRIWDLVGKPYNFPGGLAWILLRNGFKVTYVQDGPELLRRDNPEFSRMDQRLVGAANTYVELHQKAIDAGLTFEISDWDSRRVRTEIQRGNVCLLYLHVTGTTSHVVIARGIKGDNIEIIDPAGGGRYLSNEQINRQIVHPMGKRLLVVKKLPHDFFVKLDQILRPLGY